MRDIKGDTRSLDSSWKILIVAYNISITQGQGHS